jgi:hypothetical protein
MIQAYNRIKIRNRAALAQADRWHQTALLTDDQLAVIQKEYAPDLYQTNVFSEVGAVLFTFLVTGGLFLLLNELLLPEEAMGWFLLGYGAAAVGVAEWFIAHKNYYRNGIDNALLLLGMYCILYGLFAQFWPEATFGQRCLIGAGVLGLAVVRYGDPLQMLGFLGGVYGFAFERISEIPNGGSELIPFVGMVLSSGLYGLVIGLEERTKTTYYADALAVSKGFALISLVLSGNHFLMPDFKNSLFHIFPEEVRKNLLSVFFWITTFGIPLLHGFFGIKNRDRMLLILAALGTAGATETVRFQARELPLSVYWSLSGGVLLLVSAGLIRWLKTPKYGFTDAPDTAQSSLIKLAQVLTINQISTVQAQPPDLRFGGGQTGGGGAESDY